MANQDIQAFYGEINQRDFARNFQFRLESFPGLGAVAEDLIYVESLSLPGRAIHNIPVPFMGLQFNVPGTAHYPGSDAWQVTFRCDDTYKIRAAFENETARIFNDQSSMGEYKVPNSSSNLVLNLIDADFKVSRAYTFIGCYIASMGDVSYDIGDTGTIVKIPVTLAYQYWRISNNGKAEASALPYGGGRVNLAQ